MLRFLKNGLLITLLFVAAFGLQQCQDTIDLPYLDRDLTQIPYEPILYVPLIPIEFPRLEQPADNLMTIDGIHLGRKLFYDPILSIDSTISCSSCHQQSTSFTDGLRVSQGVAGTTLRGSMSLINVGFHYQGLFWDARSPTLETQAIHPVADAIEMGENWDHVEEKLQNHSDYPEDFRKAFGIDKASLMTRDLAVKAIAQFERSLISGGKTRYDRFARGEIFLEENEYNGYLMFFDTPGVKPAECSHCHAPPIFAGSDFFNNGLQTSQDFNGFQDKGVGMVTGKPGDMGKFKAPTLRNIAFTAPYMHDGRFQSLDEVLDHYNSGGQNSPTKNAFIYHLNLTTSEKSDLIAFILTLTDSSALTNPAFQNPF
ncbi:MAG: cytochrome C peroxidase [Bacteroidota bacterium]|nr:cytochrome C peroxidase [Bacteroidota bacterium]